MAMRRLGLLLLLIASTALADSTRRKRSAGGDALEIKAIEDFVEAVIADRAGDLDRAVREYESANRATPHANTYYNIADLYRRMENHDKAVENYKKYLELSPKAPDHAAVTRLVEQLEKQPGRVVIDGEDLDGVVFVDGKLVGPSPQTVSFADAAVHETTRITPRGFDSRPTSVKPGAIAHQRLTTRREQPGNVVFVKGHPLISGTIDKVHKIEVPSRMALPPGHYKITYGQPGYACAPVEFDAPSAREVTLVYFAPGPKRDGATCQPITVIQTKVRFAP